MGPNKMMRLICNGAGCGFSDEVYDTVPQEEANRYCGELLADPGQFFARARTYFADRGWVSVSDGAGGTLDFCSACVRAGKVPR